MSRTLEQIIDAPYENLYKHKLVTMDKSVLKDVLTFPKGTEFLNYFEKNPHPDKISDQELAYYEILAAKDLNGDWMQKKHDFEMVKNFLEPNLSARDRLIMRMPEKMQYVIDSGAKGDLLKACTHLRDCFHTYFSTPLDKNFEPEIQWIDYDFATNFPPAQRLLPDLLNNLSNFPAMDNLAQKLRIAGAFGKERKDFYLWNTNPRNWSAISYQARSTYKYDPQHMELDLTFTPTPQYMALGNFSINALPEGYVQPKGNGRYDICINKVYLFINDSFNFEGWEPLGFWELDPLTASLSLLPTKPSRLLNNTDFSAYQRHGYGRYFPVLSKLHEVEDFQPVCKEYPFVKENH